MSNLADSMQTKALDGAPISIVITNPSLPDNPIVFVNQAFTKLTGYSAEVCIGRNCRFLQGEETEPEAIQRLREGVAAGEDFFVDLLNYRSDGSSFLNRIRIAPLRNDDGEVQLYVGVQVNLEEHSGRETGLPDVEEALREIHHRVKNHLSMVVGMIRMQARAENANSLENYATLARRIETLQLLYQEMNVGSSKGLKNEDIPLGAYVSRISSTIAYLDGRESVRLNLDLDDVFTPVDSAAQVGLLISELLTNAYQHAFASGQNGLIDVTLRHLSNGAIRLIVADDGVGLEGTEFPNSKSLGGRIVRSLISGLGATLSVGGGANGAVFTVDVPAPALGASAASSTSAGSETEAARA